MQFTVKVGKEEVLCKLLIKDYVVANYKGKEIHMHPTEEGWESPIGNPDPKIVAAIGKAIEKHLRKK